MSQLLHYYYDVTRLLSRELISFTMEGVVIAVWRSLVNLSLKDLVLLDDFLTIASLALIAHH